MTVEEVGKMLDLLEAEYPRSFARLNEKQRALKMSLWVREFENDEERLVYAAVRLLLRDDREFAPNIGQIREKMRMLTAPEELSEADAWAMVSRACRNGIYGYEQEFRKLPEEVRRAVGAPEQLKEWATMDVETVQSVVASNFRRSYRVQQARQKELATIPPALREALRGISERMRLEDGRNSYDRERTAREAAPSL